MAQDITRATLRVSAVAGLVVFVGSVVAFAMNANSKAAAAEKLAVDVECRMRVVENAISSIGANLKNIDKRQDEILNELKDMRKGRP